MLIQVQGKRRRVILIVGDVEDDTELEYVDGTGGDFEVVEDDDEAVDEELDPDGFGLRPQRRAA